MKNKIFWISQKLINIKMLKLMKVKTKNKKMQLVNINKKK